MGGCTGKTAHSSFCVHVTAQIWEKETPNLFDFESEQIMKKEFILREKDKIVAVEQELIPITQMEEIKGQVKIMDVRMEAGVYMLKAFNSSPEHSLWRVIRASTDESLENQSSWKLKKGDTVKLGRILLKVVDFSHTRGLQRPSLENFECEEEVRATDQSQIEDKQFSCRICLSESATSTNPLLSPCDCSGSLKYCHFNCLKLWIQQQARVKSTKSTKIFSYKKLLCELCKVSYKTNFKYENATYNLLEVKKPNNPYIELSQILPSSKDHYIYLIDLKDKLACDIGRVYDCDIRLNDISVSRSHASMGFEGENLVLKDNKSKFGTLVMLDDTLDLQSLKEKKVVLQAGKAILTMQVRKISAVKNIPRMAIPSNIEICKILKEVPRINGSGNVEGGSSKSEFKASNQNDREVIIYENAGDNPVGVVNELSSICKADKLQNRMNEFNSAPGHVNHPNQQIDCSSNHLQQLQSVQGLNIAFETSVRIPVQSSQSHVFSNVQSRFNSNVMLRPVDIHIDEANQH